MIHTLQKAVKLGERNEVYFILSFSSILRIRFFKAGTTRAIGSYSPYSSEKYAAYCRTHYREVQLDFTPEMEVFYVLFERCHTKNGKRYLKQHLKYFNFRSKIQLDHPVRFVLSVVTVVLPLPLGWWEDSRYRSRSEIKIISLIWFWFSVPSKDLMYN